MTKSIFVGATLEAGKFTPASEVQFQGSFNICTGKGVRFFLHFSESAS